jgi:opacity protein-like surface antigen
MKNQIRGYEMKKVLALVVAAAMGLSSAAFAAETTAPAAAAAATTTAAPAKTAITRNIIKPLNRLQSKSPGR